MSEESMRPKMQENCWEGQRLSPLVRGGLLGGLLAAGVVQLHAMLLQVSVANNLWLGLKAFSFPLMGARCLIPGFDLIPVLLGVLTVVTACEVLGLTCGMLGAAIRRSHFAWKLLPGALLLAILPGVLRVISTRDWPEAVRPLLPPWALSVEAILADIGILAGMLGEADGGALFYMPLSRLLGSKHGFSRRRSV